VNWFRTDDSGRFVWPGFGENMRVLRWMIERIEGRAGGAEHALGVSPRHEDIEWIGLDLTRERFQQITAIDAASWREELRLHHELLARFGTRVPAALLAIREDLVARLGN